MNAVLSGTHLIGTTTFENILPDAAGYDFGSTFWNFNRGFFGTQIQINPYQPGGSGSQAQGVLTAQQQTFLIKAENTDGGTNWEPGLLEVAHNNGTAGAVAVLYGGGFNPAGVASDATAGFSVENVSSNTAYDNFDVFGPPTLTVTSCSGASLAAGSNNYVGSITSLPTGSCTIVVTFAQRNLNNGNTILTTGVAQHGWVCSVNDVTSGNAFRETATSTTTVTFVGTSVSGDVLQYGPCGGY